MRPSDPSGSARKVGSLLTEWEAGYFCRNTFLLMDLELFLPLEPDFHLHINYSFTYRLIITSI